MCINRSKRKRDPNKIRVAEYNVIIRNNNRIDRIKTRGIAIYVKKDLNIKEVKENRKLKDEGLDRINIKIKVEKKRLI